MSLFFFASHMNFKVHWVPERRLDEGHPRSKGAQTILIELIVCEVESAECTWDRWKTTKDSRHTRDVVGCWLL